MNQLPTDYASGHQGIMNFFDSLAIAMDHNVLTAPGLAINTGGSAQAKIANTVTYKVNGQFKSKTTAAITLTTAQNVAQGSELVVQVCLNASGTISLVTGTASTGGAGTALIPERPAAGLCAIGYIRIFAATGAFTGGTTALDDATITTTYFDGYPMPLFSGAR